MSSLLETVIASILAASDGADGPDNLLPTAAHGLERGIVLRRDEAGMHKANPRSGFDPGEGPGDDSVERRAVSDVFLVAALPGIGEAPVRCGLQHLAVNDTVPSAGRGRLEREALSFHRLEARRRHQPAADQ